MAVARLPEGNPPQARRREAGVTRDALSALLADAGAHPLLTPGRETDLARRVEAGDVRAREQMVASNVRLVVHIARRYAGRGVDIADLVQEGMVGLIRAVDLFDWRRGHRFSTYATWWVHQAVARGVASQGRTIRWPMRAIASEARVAGAEAELHSRLGRPPTLPEVARVAGVSEGRVETVRGAARIVTSLDRPVPSAAGVPLSELIAAPDGDPAQHARPAVSPAEAVRRSLDRLPEREGRVVRMRFGLDGLGRRSLQEVGDTLGVSRERARQIERRALGLLSLQPEIMEAHDAVPGA